MSDTYAQHLDANSQPFTDSRREAIRLITNLKRDLAKLQENFSKLYDEKHPHYIVHKGELAGAINILSTWEDGIKEEISCKDVQRRY